MRKNRLKELRQRHGLTIEELAARAGVHHSTVSRIENLKRGLSFEVAERFARAMGVSALEIMNLDGRGAPSNKQGQLGQLQEDAEPYKAGGTAPGSSRDNIVEWQIRTSVLDQVGLKPGTVAYVDISSEAVDNLKPLQCVVAQVYDPDDLTKAKTIVRQFVPPSLLITNSSQENGPTLDLDKGEAYVKGVIVGVFSTV